MYGQNALAQWMKFYDENLQAPEIYSAHDNGGGFTRQRNQATNQARRLEFARSMMPMGAASQGGAMPAPDFFAQAQAPSYVSPQMNERENPYSARVMELLRVGEEPTRFSGNYLARMIR